MFVIADFMSIDTSLNIRFLVRNMSYQQKLFLSFMDTRLEDKTGREGFIDSEKTLLDTAKSPWCQILIKN